MVRVDLAPFARAAWSRGLAVALITAAVAGCSPVRTVEAVRLLADLGAGPQAERLAAVQRLEMTYEVEGRPRLADLYPPDGAASAALVLVPGAAEEARRDPRLIAFADALTRARFLVLVPDLAGDDPLQVSAEDAVAIADAVRYLSAAADVPEVGMAALSYAVGPTVMAALYEDTRPRVRFIVSIGGYHDILAGITFITTGAFREAPGEPWRYGEVDWRAKWVFLQANADRVEDPDDARLLELIALRRLRDPEDDPADLVARLGPEGRRAYALFVNDDPDRVPELLAALPAPLLEEIEALDLARLDLGRLEARLILIHGRNDPMVPYTESVSLAGALPDDQAVLYLADDLPHVDFTIPGPGDALTLLLAAYRVLSERDAAPAPTLPPAATPAGTGSGPAGAAGST